MADEDDGFLSRWSRLKAKERDQKSTTAPAEAAPEATPVVATAPMPDTAVVPDVGTAEEAADPNADLPPIESLDRHSDYTAFLRAGVAPELRKQALRKLWRSDPVFANLDGLLEYGEDYSLPFKNRTAVATLYQVGKGMAESILDESPPAATAPAAEPRATSPIAVSEPRPAADTADAKSELSDAAAATTPDEDGKR